MYVKPLPFSLSLCFPHSSSVCSDLSVLGVWERRWRGVPEVAPSSGHGRPQRSVVRGGVSHLPLGHLHQPGVVLLVWGGRHLQPLPDQPETNQGHPQQPADQSHLSHTGTVKNRLLKAQNTLLVNSLKLCMRVGFTVKSVLNMLFWVTGKCLDWLLGSCFKETSANGETFPGATVEAGPLCCIIP